MERIPVELLYVLAFAAFILFNVIAQRAARRRQQAEEAEAATQPAPPPPAEEQPLEDYWGRAAAPMPAPAPPAVVSRPMPPEPPAPPALRRVHPARALLSNKRDLRRAVALMMVLGPCRAQEPPERH